MTKASFFRLLWKYVLPAVILPASLSYNTGNQLPVEDPQKLYAKANRLFQLPNPTDVTDSIAFLTFQQVIDVLESRRALHDTTLFFSYIKKGILLDVKAHYAEAKAAYLKAIDIKKQNRPWSDSLLYEVTVYTGSVYYHLYNFDSASYFLLQAEALSQRFPKVKEKERLYNELGALYFETGNYLQSKNYFTHALNLIKDHQAADADMITNIENNIAFSYYNLGLYSQALSIYKKLQSHAIFNNEVLMNMGKAWRALGNYEQALACFRKANPHEVPWVYNDMARTQWKLRRLDSTNYYLNKWTQWAAQKNARPNSIDAGINYLYRADLLIEQQQFDAALAALQQSIIIFSGHFNNTDIYSNPTDFTGTFTSYFLFETLNKKAATLERLYGMQKKESYLQAARSAYNSAISLLRYIEKSYDTDDAKLFLKNNSQQVYQHAFLVYLALHHLHPNAGYLEQAFITGEKSKASVMYAGVTNKVFQKTPGIDPALIHKERNIKYNLARLSIKSDQAKDSLAQEAIAKEKAAIEIELSRVQHQIEQNSAYYKQKYNETYPGIEAIRLHLQSQQALISFYATAGQLHVFVITKADLKYARIDSFANMQNAIIQWLTALKVSENGRKFHGELWGQQLYRQLVQPIQTLTGNKEQWIIIPDNILHFLPFESLPAGKNGATLLETNEISYQFSARFVVAEQKPAAADYTVLAFAPFAQKGMAFPHNTFHYMDQLVASGKEIAGLPGKLYTDSRATKQQFLKDINRYAVVHLATHAIADSSNSTATFIAFYPSTNIPAEDAIYLEELYSLNMDATRLIIVSACETGHGQLVNSEGVLSLTRGFAYAGCPSIVNSLWKADDAATSAILQRFHIYLQKGYTKSKALRQAKLDYLHSNAIYKSPGYWAHLILIGDTSPVVRSRSGYWWGLIAAIGLGLAGLIVKTGIKKRKKVDVES
jgi:CHAT domain-containing protein